MTKEEEDRFAIALFSEVLAVEGLMRSRLTKSLPKGMELSHFVVLYHLSQVNRERSPAQLSRAFNLTKGAMTNTLNKLEALGYIHIRPDWDDGRRKWVGLSEAGRTASDTAIQAVAPIFNDILGTLGSDRIKTGLPFLRDLRKAMD